jgi:cytochrome c peroxidase
MTARLSLLAVVLGLGLTAVSRSQAQNPVPAVAQTGLTIEVLDTMARLPGGLSALPMLPIPLANPQTPAKIELGRMLFLDQRLSNDNSLSCASCHDPNKGYSDGRARAVGINRTILSRRTPSLLNSAYNPVQFRDGRAKSLEDQALGPILGKNEMGMPSQEILVVRLQKVPEYRRRFTEAFEREINLQDVQRAIAAFERTLVTPDSAFDRYAGGDKWALTDPQKRGLILFIGKAACTQCHNGPNFTDNKFYSLGLLSAGHEKPDLGHFAVSKRTADRRTFKTPSLRSATLQSHFMHNGSIATLPEVIAFYNDGGGRGPKSNLLFALHLTDAEQTDLLAFLHALRGRVPERPPRSGQKRSVLGPV